MSPGTLLSPGHPRDRPRHYVTQRIAGADMPEPEGQLPLDPPEQKKAEEEKELNAHITYEVIRQAGCDELERSSSALAWSGLAAGLAMGFSFFTEALIGSYLPDAKWTPLVSKFGYTIGFLIVILGSQQLFTETTLTAVIPLLAEKSRRILRNTARLWAVVLAANLVGAFIFAAVLNIDSLYSPDLLKGFEHVALHAFKHDALQTFALGIFAGWLIAVMVWMLPAAGEMDAVIIIIIAYLVGLAGFPHIIAGAIDVFYAGLHGYAPWHQVVFGFIVPTLLGNSIGGVLLVSGLAHAQVTSGGDGSGS
jgi:formate/nitrite transporter FocA (FNT family)